MLIVILFPQSLLQNINSLSLEDVLVDCCLGNSSPINFLIDSGADVNVIGGKDWDRLRMEYERGSAKLEIVDSTDVNNLRAYATDKPMSVLCAFKTEVRLKNVPSKIIQAEFLVIPEGRRSLLGRSTASDMNLLTIGMTVNHCSKPEKLEIFPKMPNVKVKFSIDRSIPPTRNAYYNVPAAFREEAKLRLREMEARGIIEKVSKAPDWISGLSAVAKGKNDFRLVVNMRAPNRAIKREYFRLPLIQEMKLKLHGAKFFSKLDLTSAFYHLELHQESRDVTTFLAEDGMYRFTRLMFGVNCAPEIFQREMMRILGNVKNVIVYIDDILVFASSLEELHTIVAQVLQILRSNNLTLNAEKCELDKRRIKFLGHELDEFGFHVDELKVKHLQQFRQPTTVSELRSFLGLASFISPHVEHFADLTNPLWSVATSKSWNWGPSQSKAFEETKKQIARCTIALGFFSDTDKTVLYTDASPNALGAVLVQEDAHNKPRIISFASKALTSTEKKYAQNQREALGTVWAVEHFSYFLLGRHFTLRTDAQGVVFILNRSREDSKRALTRADGWALRLSPYSYDVEYVRGRENIADPSSRLYEGKDAPFEEDKSPWEIATLEINVAGFLTEEEIRRATNRDTALQDVMQALESNNWPKQLRVYQSVADDLSSKNGVLVKNGCAVIPKALRQKTLQIAHQGHPMTSKLKSILRERVWWPGISKDAEDWVKSCATCAATGRPEKPTPMERIFAPKEVWETIAMDFNGPYSRFGGIYVLLIVDYRSRFLIARTVKSTNFECTRNVMEDLFEREGFPKNIKTDNGPPFNGEEYKNYCEERGIKCVFSTPLFPQQNGLVENYMKTVNKAMATAFSLGTSYTVELRSAIQAHNSAAHSITGVAPEEVMMGRKIRRGLPLLSSGKVDHDEEIFNERDREAKIKAKEREDRRRGARKCQTQPGDTVIVERHARVKGDTRFDPKRFTVLEQNNGSLVLTDDEGQLLKRHVSQTKKVYKWRETPEYNDTDSSMGQSSVQPTSRPVRERRAPAYLHNYVRVVEDKP